MHDSTSAESARSLDRTPSISDDESTYDYHATLERLGGDADLFVDLVRFFLEDAATLLVRMEAALEAKDARTVEISAHSLKGLCSNFDARRAVAAAYAIEESARAGKLADAPESCAQFKSAVAELTEALRRLLPAE